VIRKSRKRLLLQQVEGMSPQAFAAQAQASSWIATGDYTFRGNKRRMGKPGVYQENRLCDEDTVEKKLNQMAYVLLNFREFFRLLSRTSFTFLASVFAIGLMKRIDHVRHASLRLIAEEIRERNIEGAVAELGVFKGDFAKRINIAFPDRKLYLFDTFDGFDERDVKVELDNGYSNAGIKDFTSKSVDVVMKKMKHPNVCIVKKGYFPETTKDVDRNERFVFVSIDADLFEPIYNGLCYFFPRLEKGGYIFVHDYNAMIYTGTKAAVRKFAAEFNVPFFPLIDNCGSVIIMK
jgi:O-methyltransferase